MAELTPDEFMRLLNNVTRPRYRILELDELTESVERMAQLCLKVFDSTKLTESQLKGFTEVHMVVLDHRTVVGAIAGYEPLFLWKALKTMIEWAGYSLTGSLPQDHDTLYYPRTAFKAFNVRLALSDYIGLSSRDRMNAEAELSRWLEYMDSSISRLAGEEPRHRIL